MPPRTDVKGIDGLPVIDAKTTIRIRVTQQDCNKADPKHPESCAAARAILRDVHALEARVHLGRVYVRTNKSNWQRYKTPPQLRAEIIAFDRGGTFEPGEFVLPVVPYYERPTGKRQGSKKGDEKGARQNRKKKRPTPISVKNARTGPA